MTHVGAGDAPTCSLREDDDKLVCWGNTDLTGQTTFIQPPANVAFASLDLGQQHGGVAFFLLSCVRSGGCSARCMHPLR